MVKFTTTLAAMALTTIGLTTAQDCFMEGGNFEPFGEEFPGFNAEGIANDEAVCLPQGEGQFTFAMVVGASTLGIPAGLTGGDASFVGSTHFYIMDNTCKLLGSFTPPGCGVPYTLQANFLQHVMTIPAVTMSVGRPFFTFDYGDGKFSIRNNGCVCNDMAAGGANARQGCRCAFPVNGISAPARRALGFEA